MQYLVILKSSLLHPKTFAHNACLLYCWFCVETFDNVLKYFVPISNFNLHIRFADIQSEK